MFAKSVAIGVVLVLSSGATHTFAEENRTLAAAKSITVRNVWIRPNTHQEDPWWEIGTKWQGVPAFTVYSQIATHGLAHQPIYVDVEFRDQHGVLVRWQAQAPSHCQGIDGNLRPAWQDRVPSDGFQYRAFRIPVPYVAMFGSDQPAGSYLVSVRAHCGGLSSRMEKGVQFPDGNVPPNEPFLELAHTQVMLGSQTIDSQHIRQGASRLHRPSHPKPGIRVIQSVSTPHPLPADFKLILQLGSTAYRACRPFGEDYTLRREHYVSLAISDAPQREQSKGYGRPNTDYLVDEPIVAASNKERFTWDAKSLFVMDQLARLTRKPAPKPDSPNELNSYVLTVGATYQGRSIYRQQSVSIDTTQPVAQPAPTSSLSGTIDPQRVELLGKQGFEVTAPAVEFDLDRGTFLPQRIDILMKNESDVSVWTIQFVGAGARIDQDHWSGRCKYTRRKGHDAEPSEFLTRTWSIRRSANQRFVLDLPGFKYELR